MKHMYDFKPHFSRFFHIFCVVFLFSFNAHIFSQEKPGPDNTGPTGTLEARSGGTITVDGTVIENKYVSGCLHIKASNVTIRNCVIDGEFDWYAIRCDYGLQYTNILIEDCEIINGSSAIVKGSNFTARRCNLHEANGDAFKPITNCLVEYCWIHHLGLGVDAHADGVQSRDGGSNMTFRYNNFDMSYYVEDPYKSNSPFIVQASNGIVSMLVEYNWINGGSYTMNLGNNEVIVRYNKFGRDYAYGIFYPGCDNYNSCNVWEDTGGPVDNCDSDIDVTGVTLSPASQIITVAQTINLTATVEPNDATNQTVAWSSSNSSVASVDDNGVVSALSEGLATITVTTNDGGFTATSDITVTSGASGGLNPVEDAYVRGGTYADDNYGSASVLTIKNEAGNLTYTRESYLKFDLSSLDGVPESAVLRLYLASTNGYSAHSVLIVNDDSWTETGITYNNQPTAGAEITNFQTPDVENWIEVDILSAVQSEAGGMLSLKIVSDNNSVNSYDSREGTNSPELIISTTTAQEAYNGPHNLPGIIQAEDYDIGGQDIAYNDDASKNGLATFRPDDNVDVGATSDVGGGHNVGWINNGEWLEYSLSSIENGTYDINIRTSSENAYPGDITVKLGDGPDGSNFTTLGTISATTTADWQTFETITLNDIELAAASDKVLRLEFSGNAFNLNWIEFVKQQPLPVNATLNPIADAYVRDVYYENYNYGNESVLNVKKGYSSQSMQSFLKFDLSDFAGATVESATLRLYVNANEGDVTHFVYQIDDDTWTETGITYANKPASGAEIAQVEVATAGEYIEIDVLSAVQSELGDLLSLQLLTIERLFLLTTFDSREGTNAPELVISTASAQEAYNGPHSFPGVLQAEDYDLGGQDIAYNDDASKNGLATYRPDDNVDVASTSDVGGGYNVGWISDGEWLEYTISSIENDTYVVNIRAASANATPGNITIKLGDGPEGSNFTTLGTISAPATGDWQVFETVSLNDIELAAGSDKVLRLEFSGSAFNLNWIEFAQQAPPIVTSTLNPISDAYVRDGYYEGYNYAGEDVLFVKKGYSSQSFESFLKFDLSEFSVATVESATLRLFVNANEGDVTHFVYQIDDDSWTETGLDWLNKPASGAEIAQYTVSSSGGYIDIDVLPAVQSEKGDLLSLQVLTSERLFFLTTYDSREGTNPPQLVIEASNGAIPVSAITVTPSSIALNQGASATLSVDVSPANASNTNVTWSSNNAGIATVDANGVVSALSGGQATITATSVDGGYTDECNVTVNASSTSQLMNLDAPSGARFTLPQEIVWPANVGDADVCLWHNDKYAAASISIDDNIESQHAWWLSMTNKYPGMSYTWMAMAVSVRNWSSFQDLVDAGHVVDAHDLCEINDYTDTDYRNRLIDDQNQINQTLTDNQCLTYAYPCGTPKFDLIRDLFIVMRGTTGLINQANEINYLNLRSRSGLNDLHDIRILLDENELLWGKPYNRGWLSYHYHTIGETGTEAFLAALHAKTDSIWVGTYADVAKYGQERDSHTLTVTEIGSDNIKFNLTDLMHDTFFDFPLTVKVRVPNDWNGLYATQNGSAIDVSLVENAGNKYALVKAVPDRGQVIVGDSGAKSQSKLSQKPQMSNDLSVKLYPNPLSKNNVLSVSLNGGSDDVIEGLRIVDMAGRLVYELNNISAKTAKISEAGLLKKGVYILMIKSNSTLKKQKLIVE